MSTNPNRYDIWDVNKAASQLVGQASVLGARHIEQGYARVQFTREVAYYVRRISHEVEQGLLAPEQGMEAIVQEQRDLLLQSRALLNQKLGIGLNPPAPYERIPTPRLGQPVLRPDPQRLLRFIHLQKVLVEERARVARSPRPAPADYQLLLRPEQMPKPVEYHDPGFYIVPRSTTAAELEAQLFTSPTSAILDKFRVLNPGLDQIKAGQLIVLSDPENPRCTEEEARLMAVAQRVSDVLDELSPEEADFLTRHREEIASFLNHGSTAVGIGETMLAKHLGDIKLLMTRIEELHTRTFAQHGHLRSPAFFAERQSLFKQLDSQLNGVTKKGIAWPDHPKLKNALGISSRSLVHRWGRAGDRAMNPGYATRIEAVAKAAQYVKYGGWIGTTIGGGASYMKVQEVCSAGNAEACEKVKYTEGGGFVGGVAGGVGAGMFFGAVGTSGICLALGVPTAGTGTVVCSIVIVAAGAFAAGAFGGATGEMVGEKIYGVTKSR